MSRFLCSWNSHCASLQRSCGSLWKWCFWQCNMAQPEGTTYIHVHIYTQVSAVWVMWRFSKVLVWLFLLGWTLSDNVIFGSWNMEKATWQSWALGWTSCVATMFCFWRWCTHPDMTCLFPSFGHELRCACAQNDLTWLCTPSTLWEVSRSLGGLVRRRVMRVVGFNLPCNSIGHSMSQLQMWNGFESTFHDFVTVLMSGTAWYFCFYIQLQQGSILLPFKEFGTLESSVTISKPPAIRFAAPWAKQVGTIWDAVVGCQWQSWCSRSE